MGWLGMGLAAFLAEICVERGHHDIVSHPQCAQCEHHFINVLCTLVLPHCGDELMTYLAINPWKFSLFQASSFINQAPGLVMESHGSRVSVMLGAQGFWVTDLWLLCTVQAVLCHQRRQVSTASAVREGIREQLCDWSVTREHKSANVGLAREKTYHLVATICLKICMCEKIPGMGTWKAG